MIMGSGGREHSLGHFISKSPDCGSLFFARGNAATALLGKNLEIDPLDFPSLGDAIRTEKIGFVISAAEEPLAKGWVDFLDLHKDLGHVRRLGPSKAGARLESSKAFAREFKRKHLIPAPESEVFEMDTLKQAEEFLSFIKPPIVLKADGLAQGKGVLIMKDRAKAKREIKSMFEGKFGEAGEKVLVEEFLQGTEISVFVLTDGSDYKILPFARDFKKALKGDAGPNTGGMGAISSDSLIPDDLLAKIEHRIIQPTLEGLSKDAIPYSGFLFFGIMLVHGSPHLLEYNVRLGDPESQVILPRLRTDLLQALLLTCQGNLGELKIDISEQSAACIVLTSKGYPGAYQTGKVIKIDKDFPAHSLLFHAGTGTDPGGRLVTQGGRVMGVTSLADTLEDAVESSYEAINKITWTGMTFRSDIGIPPPKG